MVQIIERKPIERKPNELTTIPLFRNLFPRDEAMIEKIADHMKANGYDDSQPIICWERAGENGLLAHVVVDGHTRLAAARRANLDNVKIMFKDFADDDEALQYAIHNQRDRRNITDADLFKCIEAVDQLKKKGGDKKSEKSKASSGAIEQGKSSKATAKIVGTSPRKVEKVRRILKKANRETVEAVKSGKKSINAACQETNTVPERITEQDSIPQLQDIWKKATMKERTRFINWIHSRYAKSTPRLDPHGILEKIKPHLDDLKEMGNRPLGSHNIVPGKIYELAYMIEKAIKEEIK